MTPYRDDLAHIHDIGFGNPARGASAVLLDALRQANFELGLVIDLACGSGILSQAVSEAGFDVLGIDLSPAMLDLARHRAPKANFIEGSLLSADLPPCVAVAIIGEGINYLFDESNSTRKLARLFARIHAALLPRGLLLLDAAGPDREPARNYREGDGWAVFFESLVDARRKTMTRKITSFRRVGERYRRDEETHKLRLLSPDVVRGMLKDAGFSVRLLRNYDEFRFPPGWTGFLAKRKD